MGMVAKRFDVFLVNLDPTIGNEIQKTRPCAIVSPDEMNRNISTVIIAPMTTKGREYPTRVICQFQNKDGQIVLDQIRTVDKSRLVKKIGQISQDEQREVLNILAEMFAE
ncbi:MAG: type II toxin-antitoxin system PemK/MazF family toxin [Pseudanabaena sp. M158S2SP1A06QC]|nr:type II toxin-antitoxin system PemK/MazF family toxin [Pseudanabaena sp. M090S1SP2A07QC]MCA6530635.1 type II toxin-antitoxin system PemK/MazF family toxin [Pseudanabaena sp. M125S2SP2A07QC]MCA6533560.1 type II toxin-antitoxin system PemK/MazF family toxin [Pseudanabaena sp. M176S2SP2A07QC]MCA6539810.1 type II toxin-antitoxin system PemK/MazF family toxin [Pseudanabaena sp. M037S2SP2A07QC]MCA6542732.1 type II toxin-antitoxin system PemK/MazF family toxin [Pseudanabaena sp. M074S1SP2A07QC]MCA